MNMYAESYDLCKRFIIVLKPDKRDQKRSRA